MNVTSVVENTSKRGLPVEHGLSLYIEMDDGRNILFDMGQGMLFADNAKRLGLAIEDINLAIVSHGHYDHGGGLQTFIERNNKAKIYIHKDAFMPHFSLRTSTINGTNNTRLHYIGLNKELIDNEQLVMCSDITHIDKCITLFAGVEGNCCYPIGNRLLFGPDKSVNDSFCHEQSMLIEQGNNSILFAGCAHSGIVNILRKAEQLLGHAPSHVFAGMHLVKSGLSKAEEVAFISKLASELQRYSSTLFHTMHCTGEEQYFRLKAIMGNQIDYLACGDKIVI